MVAHSLKLMLRDPRNGKTWMAFSKHKSLELAMKRFVYLRNSATKCPDCRELVSAECWPTKMVADLHASIDLSR